MLTAPKIRHVFYREVIKKNKAIKPKRTQVDSLRNINSLLSHCPAILVVSPLQNFRLD